MTPTQKMSATAEAAAQRYAVVLNSFRSLYQNALQAQDFGSQRQMNFVREGAYNIAHSYLATEDKTIEMAFDDIALEARRATSDQLRSVTAQNALDAISDRSDAIDEHLRKEITIQIERDIVFLTESLRRAWLQVRLAAKAQGTSMRSALAAQRIGSSTSLAFYFHDRGNAKWPSTKFVRAVFRQHLLAAYNEVVLEMLSDHGIEIAQVESMNVQADAHGMLISLSPSSELPTYEEIRNEIFHPNADAILRKAD